MIESTYIIDDDAISTYLTEAVLENEDFSERLVCFSSAELALQEIPVREQTSASPFVIFLDLNMPVMNGWDFLDTFSLRQDIPQNRCKIVILTSSIDEEEICRSKGYPLVVSFLSKPLSHESIVAVKELL